MSEELERDLDVEGEDSQESTTSTGQEGNRQPTETQVDWNKVNLDGIPNFRKFKSEQQKRESEIARQAQDAARRAQELEQRLHQERMANMDEVERLRYENQLYQQRLTEVEQQRRHDQLAWQKQQDIVNAARKLGLDKEELESALPANADSYILWEVGIELAEKKRNTKNRDRDLEPLREATEQVHVSGGRAAPSNKYQEMYDRAKKDNDVSAILDAMAWAARNNVELRE